MKNLADDPEYAKKLDELRNECIRWMEEIDDMGNIPEADILESFWPDREQPVTASPLYEAVNGELLIQSDTEGANIGYKVYAYDEKPPEKWEVSE